MPSREKGQGGHKWSERFKEPLDPLALEFTQSISFDHRLYHYDIQGSIAHAQMLEKIGLLTSEEANQIVAGLKTIAGEISAGKLKFKEEFEDIHRNIESALIEKIGPVGGKLHTGRSRNDQVALDLRLYCRDQAKALLDSLAELEAASLKLASDNVDVVMPGYTHLQRAQPILFAHHLLAYVEMWERDRQRLKEAMNRLNVLPLGSGALSGTSFPLDREFVAKKLGFAEGQFAQVTHNSLDAVSDRDFVLELSSAGAILMMHLSRLCEELILWSSAEFGFILLPQSFCTGSSMMPQKVNPDVPELVRGKTGRVYGHLVSLLTTMKSLPLAYNKDMQEDKEALFDLFETVINCVEVLAAMIPKIKPDRERMKEAAADSFLLATDLADWLVEKGSDFRKAHEVVGEAVRYALQQGKGLTELTVQEFQKFSPAITDEIFGRLTAEKAIAARRVVGGTARENVLKEIKRLNASLSLPKR